LAATRLLVSLGIVSLVPAWAVMLIAVATALVAAGLLHWFIERRLISACRGLVVAEPAGVTHEAATIG
jgi:peptidoglycan/LPS O-acetylase OafA/YrhL